MKQTSSRVGDVCPLRWRFADTAHQRLVIEYAKTAADVRGVDLGLDLIDELTAWRAERKPADLDESCSPPTGPSSR
jgi:integrase